jgi:hypothetical protein
VLVLVVLLVITNLLTAGVAVYLHLRTAPVVAPDDERVRAALASLAEQGAASARVRQFISVEILNPIELATTRGRLLGLAGSFAPGFTRRLVYDQTVKELKRQLLAQHVVADVHVHTVRPAEDSAGLPTDARTLVVEPASYLDELDVPVDDPRCDQPPV